MEKQVLNGSLELQVPEGFTVLGEEEKNSGKYYREAPKWMAKAPEKHMNLAVTWEELNAFSAFMLSAKDLAKKGDANMKTALKDNGYRSEGIRSVSVGQEKGEGYRYFYQAEGVDMIGDVICLKKGRTAYYIYSYMRAEARQECDPLLASFLSGMKLL